ncbi:hypothetical protein H5410_009409 [Solanum commersonii]|uniref:Uncharacterized protein n=1 Tax=Solanum commersonii TaxID=4109 RepID=A0A9J6AJJ6_SOLCO|nr:hypothetical protein H5410_009409 [Solanum commersonii]
MVNQKARCYIFWMIAGMMMADTSGSFLKLMYLPMLEDINTIGKITCDQPSMEDFTCFVQMVRNEGERCLTYVHAG